MMPRLRIAVAGALLIALTVGGHAGGETRPKGGPRPAADPPRARELVAEVLKLLGEGNAREALAPAREALALREAALAPEHTAVGSSCHVLAWALRDTGDYAAARPLYERALAIREKRLRPDHPALASTAAHLGYLLYLTGDYAAAQPLMERALGIREKIGGASVAVSLNDLGLLRRRAGDYAAARTLHERALAIREQALGSTHPLVAQSLANLASALEDLGDYVGARARYERALAIREQALGPNHPDVARVLDALGHIVLMTGAAAEARRLQERALAIREQALGPTHPDVALSLNSLGRLAWAGRDYVRARRLHERALAIREQALGPSHPDVAQSLQGLARALRDSGDYKAARPLFERALAVREAALGPEHPWVATHLIDLARLLQLSGDLGGALPLYQRGITVREKVLGPSHPDVAIALNLLGLALLNARDLARAQQAFERALRIGEPVHGPDSLAVGYFVLNLGRVHALAGDAAAARPLLERALALAAPGGAADLRFRAAWQLGVLDERQGRLEDGVAHYREAVQALEGLAAQFTAEDQRAQFLGAGDKLRVYDELARALLKLHAGDQARAHDREAWAVLEAKKGRVVAEAFAAVRPTLGNAQARTEAAEVRGKQDAAVALERALREEQAKAAGDQVPERIQNLTTLLGRTKTEYLAQAKAFLARYPQYKSQFVDQQTVDPRALAKFAERLPPDTVAVQYFAAEDTLYLFVVAGGGRFQVRSRPVGQAALYELVRKYRELVERAVTQRRSWSDDGSAGYRLDVVPLHEVTRALADHLLAPVEAELATHRNVILIPNDLLLYLPIHALTRPGPDGAPRFLVQSHAVSYVTQLELLDLLAPVASSGQRPLLALGNPDGSLPGASGEIRALARIRPSVTTLDGTRASKAEFLSLGPQFSDLHFATHGVLDPQHPERSYLLLAGGDEASQRLSVGEIAGLTLKPGLAILSACETAVGEQVPGAALTTLAAAFSQAGSQSVVASLWKVPDRATSDFMVAFHTALPAGGRARALQQAALSLLREPATAHPYYWAGFILIGAR